MQSLEDKYEKALLLQLPPKARDVANNLLNVKTLAELLELWQITSPDNALLGQYKIASQDWYPVINATILAKTTYFSPNPDFTQEERLYLIKAACASAGFPLTKHSLKDVITLSQTDFPVLKEWLLNFSKLNA